MDPLVFKLKRDNATIELAPIDSHIVIVASVAVVVIVAIVAFVVVIVLAANVVFVLPSVVGVLLFLDGDHSQDGVGVLIVKGKVRNSVVLQNDKIIRAFI